MSRPILYCAWFCPFAQKSWIALIHRNVDFEYKEQNPYNKSPEWLAINPRGLVPALQIGSEVVIESDVINEYIEEAWPDKTGRHSLLPPTNQPFRRSQARLWIDFVNKKMVPPMYQLLQRQNEAGRAEAASNLIASLKTFAEGMDPEGPFFMGDRLGMVDVAYVPWAWRFYVLNEYRGFRVPTDGVVWERFGRWRDACENHPSVAATTGQIDKEKLVAAYDRYAKNTATSLVAKAVNDDKPLP